MLDALLLAVLDALLRFGNLWQQCSRQPRGRFIASGLQKAGDSTPVCAYVNAATASVGTQVNHNPPCVPSLTAVCPHSLLCTRNTFRRKGAAALQYEISVVESVTHSDGHLEEFQFGSQYTPFGRLYVSVRYRAAHISAASLADRAVIQSDYFHVQRTSTEPIPIGGPRASAEHGRARAFSAPSEPHMLRQHGPQMIGMGLETTDEAADDTRHAAMDDMCVQATEFQPHSLPPRLPQWGTHMARQESLDKIVGPALVGGVARPVDIPTGKMRKVSSRSSLEEPLGSSRGSPSSFGSSLGSSPYNMFGFTPPFASAGFTPPVGMPAGSAAMGTAAPDYAVAACPLVFGEAHSATSRIVPICGFKVFDDGSGSGSSNAVSDHHNQGDLSSHAYSVFMEQEQQEFCSEQLPFADAAGSDDHDSKIGSFVEECRRAPALQMFSEQSGKRVLQSVQSLQDELSKLREMKIEIQNEAPTTTHKS